ICGGFAFAEASAVARLWRTGRRDSRTHLRFCETNPPFCAKIYVATSTASDSYDRNPQKNSVGSFWKTNPISGVFGVVKTMYFAKRSQIGDGGRHPTDAQQRVPTGDLRPRFRGLFGVCAGAAEVAVPDDFQ